MKTLRHWGMLTAVAAMFVVGCGGEKVTGPGPSPQTGSIEGLILDATNAPVPGATVATNPPSVSATSGNDGHYRLDGLNPGRYTITASASGYTIDPATTQVVAGQGVEVRHAARRQVVPPATGTLSGVVMNAAANEPIGGALVSTLPATSTVSTGADGTYTIPNVPAGNYRLVAIAPGYEIDTLAVAVAAGQMTSSRPPARRIEREPNETFLQANRLLLPDAVDGWIGAGADEQDWFSVVAPADGLLSLKIQNLTRAGTSAATLGKVSVMKADQVELAHQYGATTGAGTAESTSPVPVTAGLTYYIAVNRTGTNVARYRISVLFDAEPNADAGEPNDDRSHALSVGENASIVALVGYGNDSEDWYEVKPSAPGTLTVHVYNLQPGGVAHGTLGKVEILDASLRSLAHNYGSTTGPATNEGMSASVGSGASYFIHVVRNGNIDATPYRLEVARN